MLLHAKTDSVVKLERAIKFYDADIKILNFSFFCPRGRTLDSGVSRQRDTYVEKSTRH